MYNPTHSGVVSVLVEWPEGRIETSDLIEKDALGGNILREATLKSPGIIDEESPFSKLITDY
jgi:hypothetical protein